MTTTETKVMNEPRKILLEFILKHMDEYDIHRCYDTECFGFTNLEMFETYQREAIVLIDENLVKAMTELMHFIKLKVVSNMDKESMIPFPSSGFYLFPRGSKINLCIFNER